MKDVFCTLEKLLYQAGRGVHVHFVAMNTDIQEGEMYPRHLGWVRAVAFSSQNIMSMNLHTTKMDVAMHCSNCKDNDGLGSKGLLEALQM